MLTPPRNRGLTSKLLLVIIPLFIFVFFILMGLLTSPLFSRFLYVDSVNQALAKINAENLVEIMGFENASFDQNLPKNYSKFQLPAFALQTMTHIDFKDERSLLGNELPGFALFDTHIIAAGEGTNYTNVPNDHPPSLDYILKQQQLVSAQNQGNGGTPSNQPNQIALGTSHVKEAEILLYSTHSWDNYLPMLGLTGNPNANKAVGPGTPNQGVHLVDTWLKDDLTKEGIPTDVNVQNAATVLQKKGWNTDQAYEASRPLVQNALKSGKAYEFILDVHRDSARKNITTVQINNKSYARIDIVIGKGNPHYQNNLALAQKLNNALNNQYPGLSRGVFEKSKSDGNGVYNQDLSPHALLIDIGGVDNNETELKNTDQILANVLSNYIKQGN